MPYADSAIDYNWEIFNLDVGQRLMTVKYTADSSRPAVYLNHNLRYDQFNESDLTTIATSHRTELRVITEWDRILEATAENPTFDPNTLIGNSYSKRYKVRTADAAPYYNDLKDKLVSSDSEGTDEIRTSYTVTPMDSAEKNVVRASINITRNNLWTGLATSDYLGSVSSAIGVDSQGYDSYGITDVDFMTRDKISYFDSLSASIQGILGFNDSDWTAWLVQNGADTTGL